MDDAPKCIPRELAHRSSHGLEVTLVWVQHGCEDAAVVCVCDTRDGTHFEIPTEPHLALEVYYHPFVYGDFSSVDLEDGLAA
jgi:hypothetical protein